MADRAVPGRRRETYLGSPGLFLLNQACMSVNAAFSATCFLVGTAVLFPSWRDVDVRVVLPDEEYERLFPGLAADAPARTHAMWSLLCSSTSLWLRQCSGLPVDFQVQSRTISGRYDGAPRVPLGVLHEPGSAVSQ